LYYNSTVKNCNGFGRKEKVRSIEPLFSFYRMKVYPNPDRYDLTVEIIALVGLLI
jgi:hypothetical protein